MGHGESRERREGSGWALLGFSVAVRIMHHYFPVAIVFTTRGEANEKGAYVIYDRQLRPVSRLW
jgi:hypothetical protein